MSTAPDSAAAAAPPLPEIASPIPASEAPSAKIVSPTAGDTKTMVEIVDGRPVVRREYSSPHPLIGNVVGRAYAAQVDRLQEPRANLFNPERVVVAPEGRRMIGVETLGGVVGGAYQETILPTIGAGYASTSVYQTAAPGLGTATSHVALVSEPRGFVVSPNRVVGEYPKISGFGYSSSASAAGSVSRVGPVELVAEHTETELVQYKEPYHTQITYRHLTPYINEDELTGYVNREARVAWQENEAKWREKYDALRREVRARDKINYQHEIRLVHETEPVKFSSTEYDAERISKLENHIRIIDSEKQTANQKYVDAVVRIQALEKEIDRLRAGSQTRVIQEGSSMEQQTALMKLQHEYDQLEGKLAQLADVLKAKDEQIATLQGSSADGATQTTLLTKVEHLKDRISELQAMLEAKNEENKELVSLLENAGTQTSGGVGIVGGERRGSATLKDIEMVEGLKTKASVQEAKIQRLEKELAEKEAFLRDLRGGPEGEYTLQTQIAELKHQLRKQEALVEEKEMALRDLRGRRTSVTNQTTIEAEGLQLQIAELKQQIRRLESSLEGKEAIIAQLRDRLASGSAAASIETSETITTLRADIENLKLQVRRADGALASRDKQIADLRAEIQALMQELAARGAEKRNEADQSDPLTKQQVHRLEMIIVAKDNAIKELRQQLANAASASPTTVYKSSESKYAELKGQYDSLEQQLRRLEMVLIGKDATIRDLRQQLLNQAGGGGGEIKETRVVGERQYVTATRSAGGVPLPRETVIIQSLDLGLEVSEMIVEGVPVLVVISVVKDGPAYHAGIMVDDVLRAWNNVIMDDADALIGMLSRRIEGKNVMLSVVRAGRRMTVPVILGATPTNRWTMRVPAQAESNVSPKRTRLISGLINKPVGPPVTSYLSLEPHPDLTGIVLTDKATPLWPI